MESLREEEELDLEELELEEDDKGEPGLSTLTPQNVENCDITF